MPRCGLVAHFGIELVEFGLFMNARNTAKQAILDKISSGAYPQGKTLPPERVMAADLQVSRTTIQAVLSDLEAEGLLIRRPNCRPIVRTEPLGPIVADQIAVWMVHEMQDLGGLQMLQGITTVLGAANFRLLLGCPPPRNEEEIAKAELEFLEAALASPNVAGAIVWDFYSTECNQAYRKFIDRNVPLVFIDRTPLYTLPADMVGIDNIEAARGAVLHLAGLGHERIAMVYSDFRASSVRDRVYGYRIALTESEITVDESLIVDLPEDGPDRPTEIERTLADLMSRPNRPTAIFAVNDNIALHLAEAARRLRIDIPKKLSLVGFDWLLRTLPGGGTLTTVAQPFEEIGRTAAQRLLERIHSLDDQSPRKILFAAPLVFRSSTAIPEIIESKKIPLRG